MDSTWSTAFRYWLISVLAIVLALFVWSIRDLFPPLIAGALLAFVLNPIIDYLQDRTRLSRGLLISSVMVAVVAILAALVAGLAPAIIEESESLLADFQRILNDVQDFIAQPASVFGFQIDFQRVMPDLPSLFSESLAGVPENALQLLEATSRNFVWALVVIAATYYLLKDWPKLRARVFHLIPKSEQSDARHMYGEVKEIWRGYFRGNLALMFIVGLAFTFAWVLIGLPGAVVLGIITGVLTIIPDVGPFIAAILAILVALVEGSNTLPFSNNIWFALLVLAIYLVLVNIKAIWVRPRIFARSVHMHDGVVFIAIMASVVLWGILGAIVVVPIMASAGVLARFLYQRLVV